MKIQKSITHNDASDPTTSLIESDEFPIWTVSELALKESWRKELNRPVYHIHKWWATRLGSVFRSILIGCNLNPGDDFLADFYGNTKYEKMVVFDPFMGSGTTIGEAHRLGCTAIGQDINPIACESVRVAMNRYDKGDLIDAFDELYERVGKELGKMYVSLDDEGNECVVLYYFWTSQAPCPKCNKAVDLFTSYVFGKNHAKGNKNIRIYCPKCENPFTGTTDRQTAKCVYCENEFDPRKGVANGANATCTLCKNVFCIADAIQNTGKRPEYRPYAKLVLAKNGTKKYLKITPQDIKLYKKCSDRLKRETKDGGLLLPLGQLENGHNTSQAIKYNYLTWRDFFNDRQLLALGLLYRSITEIRDEKIRDLMLILFSSILEFNNMFASYKGEGTGAVRHMFSHHILKPERMPIEANVWGTPKSSGSFSNLFKLRLLKLLDYHAMPFDVSPLNKKHVYCGNEFNGRVHVGINGTTRLENGGIFISCASSTNTGIPDESITHVVTDPPFFDNVHYSELADFFYSWAKRFPRGFILPGKTTRSLEEVQDTDYEKFSAKLSDVFNECHRILQRDGLLIFTYHHSRTQGWRSLIKAVYDAGFSIVNAHPVKSEMSNAVPLSQAKSSIQLDVIFVCKKKESDHRQANDDVQAKQLTLKSMKLKSEMLRAIGLNLSHNDLAVIFYSQFLASIGPIMTWKEMDNMIQSCMSFFALK